MKMRFNHFFDASHQLQDSPDLHTKKCANLHGHTYKVIIEIEADNERHGMIIDFGKLKETINILDHKHINDIFEQQDFNVSATAENIAIFLKARIHVVLETVEMDKITVKVAEGYKGDEASNWIVA